MKTPAHLALLTLLAGCAGGAPVDSDDTLDPMLEGSIYRLSVSLLTIEGADSGLNDLVRLFFAQEVLARLTDVGETQMTMTLGLGYKDTDPILRNPCFGDIGLPPVSLTGMTFAFGPQDLQIPSAAGNFTIGQLALTGTISDDGERMTDMVLEGIADFRLAEGSAFGTPDSLCESFGELGAPCGPCADGPNYCADLTVTGLTASRVQGVTWEPGQPGPGECD